MDLVLQLITGSGRLLISDRSFIVVGLLSWLINNYMPMDHKIKRILNIVFVVAVVVWLPSLFGLMG